jgi:hypothetical protein
MLRISNPTAYRCMNCGTPAVLVEFPTGVYPVHCGTYRHQCPGNGSTVSDPPGTSLFSPPVWIRDTLATVATQLVEQLMGLTGEMRDRIRVAQQLIPAPAKGGDHGGGMAEVGYVPGGAGEHPECIGAPVVISADGADQDPLVAIVVALIPPQLPRRLDHRDGRADA